MSYVFKKARRENVTLVIGIAGPSGSGKTYTAMRLAAGICGDKPFAVIDTESRRALHYADLFNFDHCELNAPFRPQAYLDSLIEADKRGYPAIVVDSISHEHEGEGGMMDWHDELLDKFVERSQKSGDSRPEWQIREANNMRAWIDPKVSHKKMKQRLLNSHAHIIICFRAEDKIEMIKDEKGKTKIVPKRSLVGLDGWMPICEKRLPYELTCSFLILPDNPGVPKPIKLQEQHKIFFPLGQAITEESGRLIAQWAAGSKPEKPRKTPQERTEKKGDTTYVAEEKSKNSASQAANSSDNGHISLFPADWPSQNEKIIARGDISFQGISNKTLGELIAGNDPQKKKWAIHESYYRLSRAEKKFRASGAIEKFCEIIESPDGDISQVDASFLSAKLEALTKAASKLK